VKRLLDWLLAGLVLLARQLGRLAPRVHERTPRTGRMVARGGPAPRAETAVLAFLGLASLSALAFVVVYALDRLDNQTQLLGLCLGVAFLSLAAACVVTGKHLVVSEEIEDSYPELEHLDEQEEIVQIVEESGSRITRKRLLKLAAGGAGGAVGLALLTPAASLGPLLDWRELVRTPWRSGRRLVDERGRALRAAEIEEAVFYTAYPAGAPQEDLAAPVILVRLPLSELRLPATRHDWAPSGIVAYSKICTHAGCAVSLYRTPLFAPTSPRPALICPCHYSTFDPAAAGAVLFGPAGRPLPQLPLRVDADGFLVAAGPLSGVVGPAWWSVRSRKPHA